MTEGKTEKEEFGIRVRCTWGLSPNCWREWTKTAAKPMDGFTDSICPPCDLIQAERDKAVLKEKKRLERRKTT